MSGSFVVPPARPPGRGRAAKSSTTWAKETDIPQIHAPPLEPCRGGILYSLSMSFAKNGNSDWIVEHEWGRVMYLMARSAYGDTQSGSGWSGCFHPSISPRMGHPDIDW